MGCGYTDSKHRRQYQTLNSKSFTFWRLNNWAAYEIQSNYARGSLQIEIMLNPVTCNYYAIITIARFASYVTVGSSVTLSEVQNKSHLGIVLRTKRSSVINVLAQQIWTEPMSRGISWWFPKSHWWCSLYITLCHNYGECKITAQICITVGH